MKTLLLSLVGIWFLSIPVYGHVHLKYPEGGEVYAPGQTVKIRWEIEIPHDQKNWDLYFSTDGGGDWQTIVEDLPVADTSYDWVVPGLATTHAKILIIQDNNLVDYDDKSGDFTIGNATSSRNELISHNWKIYPNPSRGESIHILPADLVHRDLQAIYLVDATGRMIWRGNPKQEDWIMPVADQASGIYFLVACYPQEIRRQRMAILSDQ